MLCSYQLLYRLDFPQVAKAVSDTLARTGDLYDLTDAQRVSRTYYVSVDSANGFEHVTSAVAVRPIKGLSRGTWLYLEQAVTTPCGCDGVSSGVPYNAAMSQSYVDNSYSVVFTPASLCANQYELSRYDVLSSKYTPLQVIDAFDADSLDKCTSLKAMTTQVGRVEQQQVGKPSIYCLQPVAKAVCDTCTLKVHTAQAQGIRMEYRVDTP